MLYTGNAFSPFLTKSWIFKIKNLSWIASLGNQQFSVKNQSILLIFCYYKSNEILHVSFFNEFYEKIIAIFLSCPINHAFTISPRIDERHFIVLDNI